MDCLAKVGFGLRRVDDAHGVSKIWPVIFGHDRGWDHSGRSGRRGASPIVRRNTFGIVLMGRVPIRRGVALFWGDNMIGIALQPLK